MIDAAGCRRYVCEAAGFGPTDPARQNGCRIWDHACSDEKLKLPMGKTTSHYRRRGILTMLKLGQRARLCFSMSVLHHTKRAHHDLAPVASLQVLAASAAIVTSCHFCFSPGGPLFGDSGLGGYKTVVHLLLSPLMHTFQDLGQCSPCASSTFCDPQLFSFVSRTRLLLPGPSAATASRHCFGGRDSFDSLRAQTWSLRIERRGGKRMHMDAPPKITGCCWMYQLFVRWLKLSNCGLDLLTPCAC